jgi:hypothetical protein
MEWIDKKKKEKLEAERQRVLTELNAIEALEKRNTEEKQRKLRERQRLEREQKNRNFQYATMQSLHIRLALFYKHLAVNAAVMDVKDIEALIDAMRLRAYFNALDQNDKQQEKPLRFTESDELILDE